MDTAHSPRRGRYGRVDRVATGARLEVLGVKLVIEGMPISVDLRLEFVDASP